LLRVVSGQESGKLSQPRRHLKEAVRLARERGAILVAHNCSRFLRSETFSSSNRDVIPTEQEWERLLELAGGVPLATVIRPDATPAEIRSEERVRNTSLTEKDFQRIFALRADGWSLREIESLLGIPRTTLHDIFARS
jgi:hypothetical protein